MYLNGAMREGTAQYEGGIVYKGQFNNSNCCHGRGTVVSHGYRYEGDWSMNTRHGNGIETRSDSRRWIVKYQSDRLVQEQVLIRGRALIICQPGGTACSNVDLMEALAGVAHLKSVFTR
jgi:hypothetical protein